MQETGDTWDTRETEETGDTWDTRETEETGENRGDIGDRGEYKTQYTYVAFADLACFLTA